MTRDEALQLMHEHTQSPALRQHMLAAEAAMRAYAVKHGEDPEPWGMVGLLHDFDYEKFPNHEHSPTEGHPAWGVQLLRERGLAEPLCRAILGHATYSGVPRDSGLAKALFAVDELCGFLVACALVRPSRSFGDLEVSSVKKKLKDKAFARGVNRDEVRQGAEELGVPLDEHIAFVIRALRPVEGALGLGAPPAAAPVGAALSRGARAAPSARRTDIGGTSRRPAPRCARFTRSSRGIPSTSSCGTIASCWSPTARGRYWAGCVSATSGPATRRGTAVPGATRWSACADRGRPRSIARSPASGGAPAASCRRTSPPIPSRAALRSRAWWRACPARRACTAPCSCSPRPLSSGCGSRTPTSSPPHRCTPAYWTRHGTAWTCV